MPSNAWVEHVKKFAREHGTTYPCAIANKDCKNSYQAYSQYKPKIDKNDPFVQQMNARIKERTKQENAYKKFVRATENAKIRAELKNSKKK